MTESAVPKIRFAGLEGPWKSLTLGEASEVNPRSVLPEEFEYVDLESVVGTSMVGHRHEYRESAPSRAQRLALVGDIFYQTVRPYQKNNLLFEELEGDFVFSTGYAQLRPSGDSMFLFAQIQKDSFVTDVLNRCTGTSYPAINPSSLKEVAVHTPQRAEEEQGVGLFFYELDMALESGEKKLEKLRQFKQSMLVKMFPQGNSCVPEIRFAGFEGEWSGEDFEELFDFGRTVVLPREALNYNSGQGLNIHYGDILTKFSYWLTKEEELPFVDNPELVSKALARCLKQGDIIMADTAEDESVGRCVELRIDSSLPIFAGLHTYALTPQKKFAPGYLGVFMNSSMVHEQIVRFSQGTKVASISKESLKRISCLIPTYQEQARIAEYFRELDELLKAEEEKLEKLRQLKATFLQKMFV